MAKKLIAVGLNEASRVRVTRADGVTFEMSVERLGNTGDLFPASPDTVKLLAAVQGLIRTFQSDSTGLKIEIIVECPAGM